MIPEAHAYLLIESQARVKTHPIVPLAADARPRALNEAGNAQDIERCYDFLQNSRYEWRSRWIPGGWRWPAIASTARRQDSTSTST